MTGRDSDLMLADAAASTAAGAALGQAWLAVGGTALVLGLEGDLGAGKTSLIRGLLRGLGEQGPVRSPTYTLIETYPLAPDRQVHHLDFYRLADDDEVEALGFRDLLLPGSLIAIEWASRAPSIAAFADLELTLVPDGGGRRLRREARSGAGSAVLTAWKKAEAT